mmetsp:Transcript_3588/g.6358  ORF Transcript_3588/g.6358 Transcript_3588/m.6358 type:complete len:232 (+) Transcript_3588:56-751(+)
MSGDWQHASILLLLLELALVEVQLFALKHIAICAAALAGPRGNAGQETSTLELLFQHDVQLLSGSTGLLLSNDMPALVFLGLLLLLILLLSTLLLLAQVLAILLQIELHERVGIDLNNGVLQQGLGAHQFVAGGVVNHVQNPDLLGDILRPPCVVAGVKPQGSVLGVAASAAHHTDALVAQLARSGRPAHLVLALLDGHIAPPSSLVVLVPGVARDSHGCYPHTLPLGLFL